jgi:tetratricopeptide (TPR) repeat protein
MAALRRAGDLARWRMESRAAMELYERALALAGPEEGWGLDEAWFLAGIGEARYWRADYEQAERVLARASELAGDDPDTIALASRFLADIALNIRGDPERAEKEFARALDAARRGNNPWALARTLLMAGWAPYWRKDNDTARAMFEEALAIARDNPEGDRWAEARALNSLASLGAPDRSRESALRLADRALALGREMGDPFTMATAQERRSSSLRSMWRLDEALEASSEAVRIYRDLGARWELASALGDRGSTLRLVGRLAEAESDLRESWELCRELGDRVLVAYTASELAIVRVLRGDTEEARAIVEDPTIPEGLGARSDRGEVLWAQAVIALAEREEDVARDLAGEALRLERLDGNPISVAASTWWMGRFFGPEAVGGEAVVEDARRTLEEAGHRRPLEEADALRGVLVGVG